MSPPNESTGEAALFPSNFTPVNLPLNLEPKNRRLVRSTFTLCSTTGLVCNECDHCHPIESFKSEKEASDSLSAAERDSKGKYVSHVKNSYIALALAAYI